jgi:hypothetical protein
MSRSGPTNEVYDSLIYRLAPYRLSLASLGSSLRLRQRSGGSGEKNRAREGMSRRKTSRPVLMKSKKVKSNLCK